jgi:hypothetical protein
LSGEVLEERRFCQKYQTARTIVKRAPAATPPPMPPFAALESPVEVAEAVGNVEPVVMGVLSGTVVPSQSKVPPIDT